jgi:hypothetical protein
MARLAYYARNVARDVTPQAIFRHRLDRIVGSVRNYDPEYLSSRLNYYNQCIGAATVPPEATTVSGIPMTHSLFYYDLKEHARYFPRSFRLNYLFGDVTSLPESLTLVKSRPIDGNRTNAVLCKLEKFRHFHFVEDPIPFVDKQPRAVWRGGAHNKKRKALCLRYCDHPLCDVGMVQGKRTVGPLKPFLLPEEQLLFKYVISIEGVDVATNLKWILASNSLCLSPELHFETWFMEGRLEPDKHYVRLRDDTEDLEDKILYYERHPDEALGIIANANAFARQFFDSRRERLIGLLVLHKYFVTTGQLAPDPRLAGISGQRA